MTLYYNICLLHALIYCSTAELEEKNFDCTSCISDLEKSEDKLQLANKRIDSLKSKLEAIAEDIELWEEDLYLVASGTRLRYDKSSDTYEAVMCEFKAITISCGSPNGGGYNEYKIKILYADYGRHNTRTCINSESYNTDCSSERTHPYVYNLCNGKRSCDLSANYRIFGDPCVYTHKYLKVLYQCVKRT